MLHSAATVYEHFYVLEAMQLLTTRRDDSSGPLLTAISIDLAIGLSTSLIPRSPGPPPQPSAGQLGPFLSHYPPASPWASPPV